MKKGISFAGKYEGNLREECKQLVKLLFFQTLFSVIPMDVKSGILR